MVRAGGYIGTPAFFYNDGAVMLRTVSRYLLTTKEYSPMNGRCDVTPRMAEETIGKTQTTKNIKALSPNHSETIEKTKQN